MTDPTPMHRRDRIPNYVTRPAVLTGSADEVIQGFADVGAWLTASEARVVAVEVYPGVLPGDLDALARAATFNRVIDAEAAMLTEDEIDALIEPDLGDDPIFGRLSQLELLDLFDPGRLAALRGLVAELGDDDRVLVIGTGATLVAPDADLVVLADMPRWEGQQRQRRGEVGNVGVKNAHIASSERYRRAYFADWRICDRTKFALLPTVGALLDTTIAGEPKLISGEALRRGLRRAATQPMRVVPFFDPGTWGGQWIKEVCDLDRDVVNYAWAFDCVPEENSLLLDFEGIHVELPSLDLVNLEADRLLGDAIVNRFGAEFPIRFDFLDTMGGGNLSLQVHPYVDYMREHFGHDYTQDESYYMLDAEPGVASVYLGTHDGVDRDAMFEALTVARDGGPPFVAEDFVNRIPAKRHDHFLIPAGTVHSSAAGSMVLEISATPYIFTFKLWDWGRVASDGRPRPINLDRGRENLAWDRGTEFTERELVNVIEPLGSGDGWRAERTGLHATEFIETRRHWFTGTVPHDTEGTVHVLNLVEGEEAIVESPTDAFPPYVVHYAETFIVPASVGAYTIRPHGLSVGQMCATIQAYVRSDHPEVSRVR